MECVGSPCLQARGSEGSQVAEMLMLRTLLYQGPRERVGWGGLQYKEEWTDGSAARQTDTSWGSLAPRYAYLTRWHLEEQLMLVSISRRPPGSGNKDPEAARG